MKLSTLTILVSSQVLCNVALSRLPNVAKLLRNYKGYPTYGGEFSNSQIRSVIGGEATSGSVSRTEALRMSLVLNKFPGHEIPHQVSGSLVGDDGKHYIYDGVVLSAYLQQKYGPPEAGISPASIAGNRGIVVIEDGSTSVAGLWTGDKMYQMADYTIGTAKIWKTTGCDYLAELGDCEFYQCVELNYLPCGESGYATGYAHKYCTRFQQQITTFTEDGQLWVKEVTKCLTKAILPHYKNALHEARRTNLPSTCDDMLEVAFKTLPDCFVHTEPSFCQIARDNWEQLFEVFDINDVANLDVVQLMWGRVTDTAKHCIHKLSDALLSDLIDEVKSKTSEWLFGRYVEPESGIDPTCESYALDGDCRFYECFEKRFPCRDGLLESYIRSVEYPHCKLLKRFSRIFGNMGREWLVGHQKCLMGDLLSLYRASDPVNCNELHSRMFNKRVPCYTDHNTCQLLDSARDKFALSLIASNVGFPFSTVLGQSTKVAKWFQSPILDQVVSLTSGYFRDMDSLSSLLGDIARDCYNRGQKNTIAMYTLVESDRCEMDECLIKVET